MQGKITSKEAKIELARRHLIDFTTYTFPGYKVSWHHVKYADILDKFANGEIKRLMVFQPPQHGKSELCSRRLPAKMLGDNPNIRIAIVAYNHTFASKFNRDVQRIIDSQEYRDIYPETTLSGKNVRVDAKGSWLRNSDEFEIVGHKGSLVSVGTGGPLTGNKVDVAIIDDPYKDAATVNSPAYRRNLEDWWESVLETRLHNDSQICLTFTRWRHDDIAGYLLDQQKKIDDKFKWHIVRFKALKEGDPTDDDPRQNGDALWPEMHGKDKLEAMRSKSPRVFQAMYQQNPTLQSGNIVKDGMLNFYSIGDLPEGVNHCYIDTATSEKELKNNDPTGILVFRVYQKRLYLIRFIKGMWSQPDLIENIKRVHDMYLTGRQSRIFIENKSNGRVTKQILERETNYSIILENIKGGKQERLENELPSLEAGRVLLPKGDFWVDDFIEQIKGFPMMAHDEEVDCLTGAMRVGLGINAKKNNRKLKVI